MRWGPRGVDAHTNLYKHPGAGLARAVALDTVFGGCGPHVLGTLTGWPVQKRQTFTEQCQIHPTGGIRNFGIRN